METYNLADNGSGGYGLNNSALIVIGRDYEGFCRLATVTHKNKNNLWPM